MHHAYILTGDRGEGIAWVRSWAVRELDVVGQQSPDFTIQEYGVLTAADARAIAEHAVQAPLVGSVNILVIAATRMYHEAQNALLKLFEEPPPNTYLFLILPTQGGIAATLRSRVHMVALGSRTQEVSEEARAFLAGNRAERSALIKKLLADANDDDRDEAREAIIGVVSGIEHALYEKLDTKKPDRGIVAALDDISALRGVLYERGGPMKLVLEHLALSVPEKMRYHTSV